MGVDMGDTGDANVVMLTLMPSLNLKQNHGDMVDMGDTGGANVVMLTLRPSPNLKLSYGDMVDMGDTGDANVEMLILILWLSLKLNHTTTYPILIMPDTITLVKDQLMPNLSHGVVMMDMEGTGAASVALLKLNPNHGDMDDMVDTGDRTKR